MSEPLITIGMPVYNGEEYLAQAITSLLEQTFADFQIVVFDNASTDRTADICRDFAQRDSRIRVVQHDRTISAVDNFIAVAQHASTRYFCWAAHDDLHDPAFLQTLIKLLEGNSDLGLAACGCLEIDPDGTPRIECHATNSLASASSRNACDRLIAYLRCSPCSPIYGLFRTEALQQHLNTLRNGPKFGADLVFLAHFIAQHQLAFNPTRMLMLRGGGASHNADQFNGVRSLIGELWHFYRGLCSVSGEMHSIRDLVRIRIALWSLMFRYVTWGPMRSMFMRHIYKAVPLFASIEDRVRSHLGAFGRLRRRLQTLPSGSRIVIFGGGKHTRRVLHTIQLVVGRRSQIIAVCDDRAARLTPLANQIPLIDPDTMVRMRPDVVLVSSDTYERTLFRRAKLLVGTEVPVWCVYDQTIEVTPAAMLASQVQESHVRSYERSAAA
jgi:glycosyltransferase involved in cell wall biosynthesis